MTPKSCGSLEWVVKALVVTSCYCHAHIFHCVSSGTSPCIQPPSKVLENPACGTENVRSTLFLS